MKKALVTLAIGQPYQDIFNTYCIKSWQEYCEKFHFDLIVIKEPLDESDRSKKRSPAWQKLLICSQKWSNDYEQIVWVDSDIIINSEFAYDITQNVPVNKVGGVDQYAIPTNEIFNISLLSLYKTWDKVGNSYLANIEPGQYYTNRGIDGGQLKHVLQTGVFVCSPKNHKKIFEHIYNTYDETDNFENPAMSFELVKADLVTWISPRFNFCVINIIAAFYPEIFKDKKQLIMRFLRKAGQKLTGHHFKPKTTVTEKNSLTNIYKLSIFMHFAGCAHLMPKMEEISKN